MSRLNTWASRMQKPGSPNFGVPNRNLHRRRCPNLSQNDQAVPNFAWLGQDFTDRRLATSNGSCKTQEPHHLESCQRLEFWSWKLLLHSLNPRPVPLLVYLLLFWGEPRCCYMSVVSSKEQHTSLHFWLSFDSCLVSDVDAFGCVFGINLSIRYLGP